MRNERSRIVEPRGEIARVEPGRSALEYFIHLDSRVRFRLEKKKIAQNIFLFATLTFQTAFEDNTADRAMHRYRALRQSCVSPLGPGRILIFLRCFICLSVCLSVCKSVKDCTASVFYRRLNVFS